MQVEAFYRGDMDALADAADACLLPVWRLAMSGFTAEVDGLPTYVQRVTSDDDAVRVTEAVVAAVLVPARRQQIRDGDGLLRAALAEARTQLLARAITEGRAMTIVEPHEAAQVVEGTPDLDAVLEGAPLEVPPAHHFRRPKDGDALGACETLVGRLDERSQQLVELRWRQGKTARETAEVFTCGAAAVGAHERRVRRQVRAALLKADRDHATGPAAQDRLLAGSDGHGRLPFITRERLRRDILKRTFQEEPAPFSVRLRWALGAASIALVLWVLMFLRVLPYYGDDVYPAPLVEVACEGPCTGGETGKLFVQAPVGARFVAFMVTPAAPDGPAETRPLLTAPGGGMLRLPFGAREARVAVAHPATWPRDVRGPATVTAIFAEQRLLASELTTDPRLVVTSSTAVQITAAER